MGFIGGIFNNLISNFESQELYPTLIITVLLMVTVLSIFEFLVYHVVLRRALYNKAFNICITLIPYFISTIILCLQSNLIITLGTIGALAIIRFRTAVKDPIDMIFLLWSIHIGIVCGCQLYEMAIIVSVIVAVVLVVLNNVTFGKKSHVLIVNIASVNKIEELERIVKENSRNYRVKSRNYTDKGVNLVFEIVTKNADDITKKIAGFEGIVRFSLMEYDPDDIL